MSSSLLSVTRDVVDAARRDGHWLNAAGEIASRARATNASVAECLAAATLLDEALSENGAKGVTRPDMLRCEMLIVLRDLHLLQPASVYSADARRAEQHINAVRHSLNGTVRPLERALACALLPSWAAALPFGPHWALQIRVICLNLISVLGSHVDNSAEKPQPTVTLVSALNALVAVTRHWASSRAPLRANSPARCLPDFVFAAAGIIANQLERVAASTAATTDEHKLTSEETDILAMLGVSAAVALELFLPLFEPAGSGSFGHTPGDPGLSATDLENQEAMYSRLLHAIKSCTLASVAAAAAEATILADVTAEDGKDVISSAGTGPISHDAASTCTSVCAAVCAVTSAALVSISGPTLGRAFELAPLAATALVQALHGCLPPQSCSEVYSNGHVHVELQLAARELVSQCVERQQWQPKMALPENRRTEGGELPGSVHKTMPPVIGLDMASPTVPERSIEGDALKEEVRTPMVRVSSTMKTASVSLEPSPNQIFADLAPYTGPGKLD